MRTLVHLSKTYQQHLQPAELPKCDLWTRRAVRRIMHICRKNTMDHPRAELPKCDLWTRKAMMLQEEQRGDIDETQQDYFNRNAK